MIIFSDSSGDVGTIAVIDDVFVSDFTVRSVAETWVSADRLVSDFEDAYAGWSNGSASSRRVPDDIAVIKTLDKVSLSSQAFHLPGRHDQDSHGRRGIPSDLGRVGGGLKAGKAIKVTHGLIHKKHADNTTIAITKGGDKKVTWNGKAYNLEKKQADGSWKTEDTAIKSKAYAKVNDFASDWHEPEGGKPESEAPKPKLDVTPTAPPAAKPTPKKNGPGTTVHNSDVEEHGLKAGEPIHLTQSMFSKTYKQGTIIAVNEDATKKITSYGSYYELQDKDSAGKWGWGNSVLKAKALDEAMKFGKNWFAPEHESAKPEAPKATKTKTLGIYASVMPGKKIEMNQEFIDKDHPNNKTIAVSADGMKKLNWVNGEYEVAKLNPNNGMWGVVQIAKKDYALDMAKMYSSDWHEPEPNDGSFEPGVGITTPNLFPTPPPPQAPRASAPAPSSPPVSSTPPTSIDPTGPKTFTMLQKAKVTSIFAKNGVKWHTDSKKIYDAALEVSKANPELTMADSLAIMDESLSKKTGDPFQTKMTKFLSTKAGMKYAQEKGYSAPAGGTSQAVMPGAKPSGGFGQPGSTVPGVLPIDNGPAKSISYSQATAMQAKMNEISPPPWTGGQRASLTYYTGSAYTTINKCLRGTGECSKTTLAHIKDIKGGMKPSTQNIMVYRKTAAITLGLSSAADAKSLIGTTIKDDGAISTSISQGKWSGQIHMEIEAPVGSMLAWVAPISHYKNENEIILAPGTEFEVIGVSPNSDGSQTMRVRIVPGSGS